MSPNDATTGGGRVDYSDHFSGTTEMATGGALAGDGTGQSLDIPPEPRIAPTLSGATSTGGGPPTSSVQADRFALVHWQDKAKQLARALVLACKTGDMIDRGNVGIELNAALQELWKRRSYRSDEWREFINYLQGLLAKTPAETFTVQSAAVLANVLSDFLRPDITERNLDEALDRLQEENLDIWAGISGDDTPESDTPED